jgi:hypothetical protein
MCWKRTTAYGGNGGNPFADNLTEACVLIGFNINSGSLIDGIQGIFRDCDGNETTGTWYGGSGGNRSQVLFSDGETLSTVNGRSGEYVDQLTFVTNRQTYTFGGDGGDPFSLPASAVIGGFFGSAGRYIDQFGLFESCGD